MREEKGQGGWVGRLNGTPMPRSSLVWLLLWLVVLDVLLRVFQAPIYNIWSLGPIQSYRQTEALWFAHDAPTPRVVVLGSSEAREAVASIPFEAGLGLRRGEVMNLAVRIARPSDMLEQYLRHRDVLARADIVLVGLEEWHLNAYTERVPDERFRYRATFRERALFPVPSVVPELLLGYVWATWDMRRYFFQLGSNRLLQGSFSGLPHYLDDIGRTVPGEPQARVPWSPELDRFYASSLFRNYTLWGREMKAVSELARVIREDGAAMVLIQFPKRRSYLDQVEATYGRERALWLETVARIAPDVSYVDLRAPEPFGLQPSDFLDHIHVSHDGSALFSRRLGERMRSASGRIRAP